MTSNELLKLAKKIDKEMTNLLVYGNHDYGSDDVKRFNQLYSAIVKANGILQKALDGTFWNDQLDK